MPTKDALLSSAVTCKAFAFVCLLIQLCLSGTRMHGSCSAFAEVLVSALALRTVTACQSTLLRAQAGFGRLIRRYGDHAGMPVLGKLLP